MNFDDYIGIPFKAMGTTKEGCNCWALVCMIYKDHLGIDLPTFAEYGAPKTTEELIKITKVFRENKLNWINVKKPKFYDVILLRSGSMLYHCGLVIGKGQMIHIDKGVNSIIESYTSKMWKDKVEGFYRYAE